MNTFDHRRGRHLDIDGARIYYEIAGSPAARTLLFLHGGLGNIQDFNGILPALSPEFRLIGIDSRGQGASTLGRLPLSYERMQRDVERVLHHLHVNTLSIVGFSDGGITAYRLACMTSLDIEKLITIGAEWKLAKDDPMIEFYSRVTAESWKHKFPASYSAYERLNPEPDFHRLVSALVPMWSDTTDSGYPAERVDRIRCPMLLIRGDQDHLVTLDTLVELQKRVPISMVFDIPLAGHVVHDDQRDIFVSGLRQFLNQPL
jgi:pimeloyl-ACP methyl ester carboxylesterase